MPAAAPKWYGFSRSAVSQSSMARENSPRLKNQMARWLCGLGEVRGLANEFVEVAAGLHRVRLAHRMLEESVLLGRARAEPDFPERVGGEPLYEYVGVVEHGRDGRVGFDGPDQPEREHRGAAGLHVGGGEQPRERAFGVPLANGRAEFAHGVLHTRGPQLFIVPRLQFGEPIVHFHQQRHGHGESLWAKRRLPPM